MGYQRGIVSTVGGDSVGALQNVEVSDGGEEAKVQDKLGSTIEVGQYDGKKELSCEFVWDTAETKPARGDILTVTGKDAGKYQVDSVTDKEDKDGFRVLSISAWWYHTATTDVPSQT